jgi:hypothetical protein
MPEIEILAEVTAGFVPFRRCRERRRQSLSSGMKMCRQSAQSWKRRNLTHGFTANRQNASLHRYVSFGGYQISRPSEVK